MLNLSQVFRVLEIWVVQVLQLHITHSAKGIRNIDGNINWNEEYRYVQVAKDYYRMSMNNRQ